MEKNIYTEESRNDKNETVTKEAKSEKCADVVEVEKQKNKKNNTKNWTWTATAEWMNWNRKWMNTKTKKYIRKHSISIINAPGGECFISKPWETGLTIAIKNRCCLTIGAQPFGGKPLHRARRENNSISTEDAWKKWNERWRVFGRRIKSQKH